MRFKHYFHELRLLLGIERNTTSHSEKWISGAGALMGILAVYWVTRWVFPNGFMENAGNMEERHWQWLTPWPTGWQ